jgi:isopenicillin-N epimerase
VVTDLVAATVNERTRIVVIDHVTSPTALILPVEQIIRAVAGRSLVLVDGAHSPGMIPIDVESIGADFYTGNCHKWMCAPKGAAFLWAAEQHRDLLVPGSISHGLTDMAMGSTRLRRLFDFTGTDDPTAWLSVPAAIDLLAGALDGGWPAVMAHNRALALAARDVMCQALALDAPAPDDMIGSMAALPVADAPPDLGVRLNELRFEVPVFPWSDGSIIRISAQLHNSIGQYQRLAEIVGSVL